MNFLEKIIPFLDGKLSLTSWWVSVSIIIFSIALVYLIHKSCKIIKILEFYNPDKNGKNTKKNNLVKIWVAYKSSFIKYGDLEKTTEYSEDFFNEQNILYVSLNLRIINNVSAILVGLGILGTFVGLTYGIAGLNTKELTKSIDVLLSGMGTAFVSSIWGMGLSLIFTIVFKIIQSRLTKKIQNTCLDLDNKYKIKPQDFERIQQENQRKIINELFNEYLVADTDEGKQLPKNIFRQLLEESVKQTTSLQSFSDDLGESIQVAMEKLVEDNSQNISNLIEEKLVPVLEDLKIIKQDSGTQVIEGAVSRLADSMKNMMDDFKQTITGDTKQEMENLVKRLTTVSESLVGIPNTMNDITYQVSETIKALKEVVISNIEKSKNSIDEMNKNNKEIFSSATVEYRSTVEDIQSHMELLLSTQKDNIKQVSDITTEIKTTLKENSQVNKQIDSIIQKSGDVAKMIEDTSSKFGNSSTVLNEVSDSLKVSITNFESSIDNYVNKNNILLDHQEETLLKTKDISELYGERFEIIESGLSGIFEKIQIGLKDYQETTADNLNKYLTEFSKVLTGAHKGLESNVSGLNDITDELVEQLEEMRKKK